MKISRSSIAVSLVSLGLGALLLFSIWGSIVAWRMAGDVKMSVHGYIAMALAAVFTLLFTGGFLWLAYFSARRGFDDVQHDGGELDGID